jgi:hypothetical protein
MTYPSIKLARFVASLLLVAGFSRRTRAVETSSATTARGADSILERSRRAMRPSNVSALRSIVMEGTYEYTSQSGLHAVAPLYEHWRAPGILYQDIKAPFGLMRRWSDGDRGWASRPEFPNRPLGNAEISEARRDAALYQPAALAREYTRYVFEGRRAYEGREFDVVAAQSRLGRTERFYFDPATGLAMYLEVWEEGPEGLRVVGGGEFYQSRYVLEDYRLVDGLRVPFHVQRQRPSSLVDMRFDRVRVNVAVDTTREKAPTAPVDTITRRP